MRLCEHMNRVISCPFGRRLKIDYAMYGRLSRRHCSTYARNSITNCSATSSLAKTKSMCDGRTWCVLSASNGVYGDPCVGVYKYLNVRYRCIWSVNHNFNFFVSLFFHFSIKPFTILPISSGDIHGRISWETG